MYKQEVIKFFNEFKMPFIVPQIPTIIRYRDEFTEKIYIIENLHEQEVIYIYQLMVQYVSWIFLNIALKLEVFCYGVLVYQLQIKSQQQ